MKINKRVHINLPFCATTFIGDHSLICRIIFIEDHIRTRLYKSLLPGRQTSRWSFWHVVFHENNSKKLTACSSVVERFQNFSGSYSDQDLFISKGGSEKEIYVPEEGADTGLFASVLQVSNCKRVVFLPTQ